MDRIKMFWESIEKIAKKYGYVLSDEWEDELDYKPEKLIMVEKRLYNPKTRLTIWINLYIWKTPHKTIPFTIHVCPSIYPFIGINPKHVEEYARIEPEILKQYLELVHK